MKLPKINKDILIVFLSAILILCGILFALNYKTFQTKLTQNKLDNAINSTASGDSLNRKQNDPECRTQYQGWTVSNYTCSIVEAAIYKVNASEVAKVDDNFKRLEDTKYVSEKYDAWLTSVIDGAPRTEKKQEYVADLLSGRVALAEFKYVTKDHTTLNIALLSNKYQPADDRNYAPASVGRAFSYIPSLKDDEYLYVVRASSSFTMPEFLDHN